MKNTKDVLTRLPTFGILLFIGLYIYAASLYPGGSQADPQTVGFDWSNNFWCNLMLEKSMNGVLNPARPIAISAITILSLSMMCFFFLFAVHFERNRIWKIIIKISGVLAMISAIFIFTSYHDVMTTTLSIFGTLVLIGMIRALHKRRLTFFKITGILCILMIALNNFMYYDPHLILYLPIIQKVNFVLVLGWTIALNLKMTRLD